MFFFLFFIFRKTLANENLCIHIALLFGYYILSLSDFFSVIYSSLDFCTDTRFLNCFFFVFMIFDNLFHRVSFTQKYTLLFFPSASVDSLSIYLFHFTFMDNAALFFSPV